MDGEWNFDNGRFQFGVDIRKVHDRTDCRAAKA